MFCKTARMTKIHFIRPEIPGSICAIFGSFLHIHVSNGVEILMTDANENPLKPDDTTDRTQLSQEAQQRVKANMDRARELKAQRELDKQAKAGA